MLSEEWSARPMENREKISLWMGLYYRSCVPVSDSLRALSATVPAENTRQMYNMPDLEFVFLACLCSHNEFSYVFFRPRAVCVNR